MTLCSNYLIGARHRRHVLKIRDTGDLDGELWGLSDELFMLPESSISPADAATALDFHEKAGVCQAPGGFAVKVARLQHSATPFALLPSALLTSPVWAPCLLRFLGKVGAAI
jgi:hypothetical protein